jgi:uncharacterized cupredoxin-like copper-binding protein
MEFHALVAAIAVLTTSTAALAGDSHAGGGPIGTPGKAAQVTRTVDVDMSDDMRFTPASIQVRQGETVRFRIKNSGALKHEFVLGTAQDLKAHYQAMLKFPEMEHEEPHMVTLAGGKTGEVIWRFTQAGKVDFACLQPGHYDAGMKGAVTVAKGSAKPGGESPSRQGRRWPCRPPLTARAPMSRHHLPQSGLAW